jgi:hypothetical protein
VAILSLGQRVLGHQASSQMLHPCLCGDELSIDPEAPGQYMMVVAHRIYLQLVPRGP